MKRVVGRLLVALLLAIGLALAPLGLLGLPQWFSRWLVPLGILGLICYMGAVLVNTFFFDRYPR